VRESEWRAALVQLRDALCYCQACKAENFYDAEAARSGQANGTQISSAGNCWACGQAVRLPPRIRIIHSGAQGNNPNSGQQVIVLRHDSKLFPHHVDRNRHYDFSHPVAEIAFHPTNPSVWGLKNLADDKWVATTAGGDVRDVPPGRTVTIATGTRIQFGYSEGILRL
jgi:hypothetical protein